MLQDLLSFWLFKMVQQNLCMRLSLDYILEKKHWMPLNQVALAIDRASSMTRHRKRLVARICAEVLTLINVHCIMHREL